MRFVARGAFVFTLFPLPALYLGKDVLTRHSLLRGGFYAYTLTAAAGGGSPDRLVPCTIYTQMAQGKFPRPLRIGHRAVAWNEEDIEGWLAARTNILVFLFPVHVENKKTTFSSTLPRWLVRAILMTLEEQGPASFAKESSVLYQLSTKFPDLVRDETHLIDHFILLEEGGLITSDHDDPYDEMFIESSRLTG